jgi:N-carbamoyl-L-amino-acid hydrolase
MTGPRVSGARLMGRLRDLRRIGALEGGRVCRLTLTDDDTAAHDRLAAWMRALGLAVSIDVIGNIRGVRAGVQDGPPIMIGSHIDPTSTRWRHGGDGGALRRRLGRDGGAGGDRGAE